MIIDFFGSLKDNIIKKVKNPFLGTFGIVFLLKNWQLFYSLFYFDPGETRLSRIQIIEEYISFHGGTWGIFSVAVLYTIIVLIISYSLSLIGTYIGNFSDSIAVPFVTKIATKGTSIVTKEKYDRLDARCKKLEDQLKDEREKRITADIEREKAEKDLLEYKEANKPKNPLLMNSAEAAIEVTSKRADKKDDKEKRIVEKIIENNWSEDFSKLITSITKQDASPYHNEFSKEMTDFLSIQDIIEIKSDDFNANPCYFFTEFGSKVKNEFAEKLI